MGLRVGGVGYYYHSLKITGIRDFYLLCQFIMSTELTIMTKRERKVERKLHTDAEVMYRTMQKEGFIIICTLPRKKYTEVASEFTLYKPCLVLSDWN